VPEAPPPRLGASLQRSAALMLGRFGRTIALGAAIVLALVAVCFGIGVLLAPWLLCELLALQLGEALGRPIARSRSWVAASAVLLGAVLLTASVGWLTGLGLGDDAAGAALRAHEGSLLALASAVVSLVFVLPFLYAPLVSIEAGVGLGAAVLESARLVSRGGVLRHLVLSLSAHAVSVAPPLLAACVALSSSQAESAPTWAALSLPLLSLTVPLGQGMVVSAYAERRESFARARVAGQSPRPPRALLALWVLLVAAPLLSSFSLLGVSFVRPSRLAEEPLPDGGETIAAFARLRGEARVQPPDTALEIRAGTTGVEVVTSDGGGVGHLPLRSRAPIEALRVVRVRDSYGIELVQAGRAYSTVIDRSGVRLDDDPRARLLDRVPSWALLLMLLSLLSTAALLLPVLAALGELRRSSDHEPVSEALSQRRMRTLARSSYAAAALVPLAALSLYWALHGLLAG
jgi:hypothetical protein